MILVLLVCVFLTVQGTKPPEDYCAISKAHTMCQYQKFNSLGLRCRHFHPLPTKAVKRMLLREHNSIRNSYASNWQFTVPNMMALEWDEELTEIAARWAMQCPYYEDDFRDVVRFKVANMVAIGSDEYIFPNLLDVWQLILENNLTFYKIPEQPSYRHRKKLECAFSLENRLTLITNPYFRYVGCAAAIYRQFEVENELFKTIIVCNYGPLEEYYEKFQIWGAPCSRCPNQTFCRMDSKYPNLCAGSYEFLPSFRQLKTPNVRPTTTSAYLYEDNNDVFSSEPPPTYSDVGERQDDVGESQDDVGDRQDDNSSRTDDLRNATNKYCQIICPNGGIHTMCKYTGPSEEYDEVLSLLGKSSKEYILTMHNGIRDDVAGTKASDDGSSDPQYPLAANMRELVWSRELERIAHRWAVQCKAEKDECRNIIMGDHPIPVHVSQLMAVANWSGVEPFPSITEAFYSWMMGLPYLNISEVVVYRNPTSKRMDYSSYAQIIWADTFMMGCAMSLCRHNERMKDSRVFTVCNYAPGGMLPGHSVFKFGGPCSSCRKLFRQGIRGSYCSVDYKHLCSWSEIGVANLVLVGFSLSTTLMAQ